MRTGGLLPWLLVVAVVAAPLLPVAPAAEPAGVSSPGYSVGMMERLGIEDAPDGQDVSEQVDREVQAIIELKRGASVPEGVNVEREYTREGARRIEGVIPISSVDRLSQDPRIREVHIREQVEPTTRRTAPGVAAIGAQELHAKGVTGDGVTVGVIDRGFRPGDPEIAANVGAYRTFDADGAWRHGTGVASVVVDTAPDARLHLAAIGPTTTPAEYREAVTWLRESGADVIVDSGSYFGGDGNGGEIAAIAERAAGNTVFVTSAGNYAERHWAGTHEATGERGWLTFGDRQGNALGDGPVEGTVSVGLGWDDPTADYDLYLMRQRNGEDVAVATSTTRQDGETSAIEEVTAKVARGRYYVSVRAHDANGTHDVELFASHELAEATAGGSLTIPGTVDGVVTVGSYGNDSVKAFSSRGPVGDRTGVDLVAPDSVVLTGLDGEEGTSYAAPYVAGTVALLRSEFPGLGPGDLRAIVTTSSRDVGPEGPDVAAGHGLVDAQSAYQVAFWQTRYERLNATG